MPGEALRRTIRVAAAADLHCGEGDGERMARAFTALGRGIDLVLLAGDLTTHGEPGQAAVLAAACAAVEAPVLAVLGNHDWHADRAEEVRSTLEGGGVRLLEHGPVVLRIRGCSVGVAGVKGFVGGFPDASLPDFGEPSLRRIYAETTREVDALDEALAAVGECEIRLAVLHYAPTTTTLGREPKGIWAFLGSDRLAQPLLEHRPHLVVHGHAHAGAFEGFAGAVPVYNVAVPVTGRDFWVFEVGRDGVEPQLEREAPAV